MTITPERLRNIVSALIVAAEHRADDLDELCKEVRDNGEIEAADDYQAQLSELDPAINEARAWLAAVPAGTGLAP